MEIPVRSCLRRYIPPTIYWRVPPSPAGGVIEQNEGRTSKTPSTLTDALRTRDLRPTSFPSAL